MKSISNLIVKHHKIILALFIVLAVAAAVLMFQVNINADMTKYLPEDSPAKRGAAVLTDEFPPASTFTLMFDGLPDERKPEVAAQLTDTDGVLLVAWDESERYNNGDYTLYEITVGGAPSTPEAADTVDRVRALYPDDDITISGDAAGNTAIDRMPTLLLAGGAILLVVLFLMGASWFEPVLLLITVGIAILLNMGTNVLFDSVSEITYSIAAILQLCLSIDYSIMLLSRYRQERALDGDKREAMKRALQNAVTAISGSSITTIAGMLALTMMSFTIGMDLGLVLAKGVFFSLLCIFTVLPALVIIFDKQLEKTRKKAFLPKMTKIGTFEHKRRYAILAVFVLLLVGGYFMRSNVDITYSLSDFYDVNKHFAVSNPIVVVYNNEDEEKIAPALEALQADGHIESVESLATTLGREYTADEFSDMSGLSPMIVSQLYQAYGQDSAALKDMIDYIQIMLLQNPMYQTMMPADAMDQLAAAGSAFQGEVHSRAILNTTLPQEGDETFAFVETVTQTLDAAGAPYDLVGNSAVAYEMHESFPGEMSKITIITVLAIFLIVALVFRKLTVPLILTLIIQCAVWIVMGTSYLQGISMYYLPLLIVQCLLLGAMVDYGILYADYYRKARETLSKQSSVIIALRSAIHTILTSGLVLIAVTVIVGLIYLNAEPAISEIVFTIAKGTAAAIVLIIFVLPGVLAALDRGKDNEGKDVGETQ